MSPLGAAIWHKPNFLFKVVVKKNKKERAQHMSLILNKAFITEPSVPVSKGDYLSLAQKFTSQCRSREEDFTGVGSIFSGAFTPSPAGSHSQGKLFMC